MVKIDDSADHLDVVRAIAGAGIPLWCQFGFSVGTSMAIGGDFTARSDEAVVEGRNRIVQEAKDIEEAGASMLDLTNVTPDIYAEVQQSVKIPVLGGQTGPEADGRILVAAHRASAIDWDDLPINRAGTCTRRRSRRSMILGPATSLRAIRWSGRQARVECLVCRSLQRGGAVAPLPGAVDCVRTSAALS